MSKTGLLNEKLKLKFEEILRRNGINESISEVIVKDGVCKGENLASKAESVTLKFHNSERKPLHLFMKTEIDNPTYTAMLVESKFFEKEGRFFLEYLPAASAFCQLMGRPDLLDIYPKCYYADEKMIVFENLQSRGFVQIEKLEMHDFELSKIALTSLAIHHAIAHALEKKSGSSTTLFEKYQNLEFEGFNQPSARKMIESAIYNGIETNLSILQKSKIEGREEAIQFLEAAQQYKPFDLFINAVKIEEAEDKMLVLNHGDYWNNNMMFQFDRSNVTRVTSHVMFDFQITRYGNLCLDLNYYMYTSLKPAVRRERLQDLLRIYLDALKRTSKYLGYPIDINFQELLLNFRKKINFGFWFAILLTNGLSFIVRKDIDPAELEDLNDFGTLLRDLSNKWLEDHPEELERFAKETVQLIEEYNQHNQLITTN